MMTTDPIADYLTRVRNAIQARHKKVLIPASGMKKDLTRILAEQKFIGGFEEITDDKQGIIRIALKYTGALSPITGLKRVSTPGRRVYVSAEDLPRVMNGLGIAVISTSRGMMTDKEARAQHLGGEVVCEIW